MAKTKILKEGWGAAPTAFYVSAMRTTDDPIGLIIEQSGFTNRTTFARLFAAYNSMTPSEYRKVARKQ